MTSSLHQGGIVKASQIAHTIIYPLAHILNTYALLFSSCALFTAYPSCIMGGWSGRTQFQAKMVM